MIVGIGLDIVELSRMAKMDRCCLDKFAARVLSLVELDEWNQIEHLRRKVEFLAGRFAVKEAVAKAFGTGIGKSMFFQDIGVVKDQNGKPDVVLTGRAKSTSTDRGVSYIWISISHSSQFAVAQAILEKKYAESND